MSRKVFEYKKANPNKKVLLYSRRVYVNSYGAYGTVFVRFSFRKGSSFVGDNGKN